MSRHWRPVAHAGEPLNASEMFRASSATPRSNVPRRRKPRCRQMSGCRLTVFPHPLGKALRRTLTHPQAQTPLRAAGFGPLRNRRINAALTRKYDVESMYQQESLMEQVEKTIEVNCPISTV